MLENRKNICLVAEFSADGCAVERHAENFLGMLCLLDSAEAFIKMGSTEGAHQMSQPQLRLRCSQGRRRVPVCDARSCETNNSIRRRRQFPQQSSPRGLRYSRQKHP